MECQRQHKWISSIGVKFVKMYFSVLNGSEFLKLANYYHPSVKIARSFFNTNPIYCEGKSCVEDILRSYHKKLSEYNVVIKDIDTLPSLNDSILIHTTLQLNAKSDGSKETMTQSFVLSQEISESQKASYYIFNDMVRSSPSEIETIVIPHETNIPTSVEQQQSNEGTSQEEKGPVSWASLASMPKSQEPRPEEKKVVSPRSQPVKNEQLYSQTSRKTSHHRNPTGHQRGRGDRRGRGRSENKR